MVAHRWLSVGRISAAVRMSVLLHHTVSVLLHHKGRLTVIGVVVGRMRWRIVSSVWRLSRLRLPRMMLMLRGGVLHLDHLDSIASHRHIAASRVIALRQLRMRQHLAGVSCGTGPNHGRSIPDTSRQDQAIKQGRGPIP